jgi:uncharacterized protein YkwD
MRRALALTTVTAAWVLVIQLVSGAVAPPRFVDLAAADVVRLPPPPSQPEFLKTPVLFQSLSVDPGLVSLPVPSTTLPDPTNTPSAPTTTAAPVTTTAAPLSTTTLPAPSTTTVPPPTTTAAPATTAAPTTTVAPTTTTAPAGTGEFSASAEADFFGRINSLRSSIGAAGLAADASLNNYARWWARQMAITGDFAHSNISSLLGPWTIVGENIGYGPSVSPVFSALVNSPSHYANMVDTRFTAIGVGVYVDASGYLWTAHIFGG